jgi:ABC-2 type transport system permease protein
MNKILLVTRREYITRVRKRSFIIMTIVSPLLIILFYGMIFYFSFNRDIGDTNKEVFVSDHSGLFKGRLKNSAGITFSYGELSGAEEKNLLSNPEYYGILVIPQIKADSAKGITFISHEQASLSTIDYIESQLEKELKDRNLHDNGIDNAIIEKINSTHVKVNSIKLTSTGLESSNAGASTALGFFGAIIIYIFILLYSVQIMRGVIEEKTNRIAEVIISSVKPFQLMMGKIIGIAMVGITQFVIWVVLIALLSGPVSSAVLNILHVPVESLQSATKAGAEAGDAGGLIAALGSFNYGMMISMFLFFFITGYLFYGSLFAAVGSAVDSETDTQQFMLPLTLPLVFALGLAQGVVMNAPNGNLAVWLSMIPFTSPIVMMVRVPFGVPVYQLILSMLCMIAGFLLTVWIAARVYRIGILIYGKKPSYREIWKWLWMSN